MPCRLADAEDVKAVLEELAQRPDLENPTKMALGLLRSLSAKGPFQARSLKTSLQRARGSACYGRVLVGRRIWLVGVGQN